MNLVPAPTSWTPAARARSSASGPSTSRPGASATGLTFDAHVEVVEYLGDEQLVHLDRNGTPLLAKLPIEQYIDRGTELTFSIPRDKLHRFDADTGERLEG